MAKTCKISIGDRVAYSAQWLRSTSNRTGDLPFLRGTVRQLIPFGSGRALCGIEWDNCRPHDRRDDDNTHDAEHPGLHRVLDANLTLVKRIAADAALAS